MGCAWQSWSHKPDVYHHILRICKEQSLFTYTVTDIMTAVLLLQKEINNYNQWDFWGSKAICYASQN